jgi:hypothetical protein
VTTVVIDPGVNADVDKSEAQFERYLEEDAFRVFGLDNDVYGQRPGGHDQMVRIKVPTGPSNRINWR